MTATDAGYSGAAIDTLSKGEVRKVIFASSLGAVAMWICAPSVRPSSRTMIVTRPLTSTGWGLSSRRRENAGPTGRLS